MRQSFIIGLTLLVSAAFVSCTHEVLNEKPTTHIIRIQAEGQDTRTQIDGTSSLWTEGDRLLVYQSYYPDKVQTTQLVQKQEITGAGTMIDGGQTMDFTVQFDYVDPSSVAPEYGYGDHKFKYQAAYPGERAYFDPPKEDDADDFGRLVVPLLNRQSPTNSSFDPNADILTSRQVYLPEQPSILSLAFKRQTALGQMTLKGLPLGAKVYNVAFVTGIGEDFIGPNAFVIDLSEPNHAGSWVYDDNYVTSHDDLDDYFDGWFYIWMEMPDGWTVSVGSSGATEVMTSFMCCPFSLGQNYDFSVFFIEVYTQEMIEDETTGDSQLKRVYYSKRIELNSNRELVFTAGDATIFSVDMSQADRYVQG